MKKDLQEKLAGRIAGALHSIQSGWAGWMNRHCNGRPLRLQKIVLLLWAAGMGSLCACLIVQGFVGSPRQQAERPEALEVPGLAPGRNYGLDDLLHYTDSIKKHAPDQWDSLLKYRPGLADTLRRLQQTDQW